MKRVAILISGGGSNMVALVNSMVGDHPARPVVVISNRPGAGGLARAEALGVTTELVDHKGFETREAFDAALHEILMKHSADMLCLAGFMRIFTPGFVNLWQGRCINIHPSLLPRHPGLNTHEAALTAEDKTHGCTVHEVTDVLDNGPILGQAKLTVRPNETADELAGRVLKLEHQLYPRVLRRYVSGDRTPVDINELDM